MSKPKPQEIVRDPNEKPVIDTGMMDRIPFFSVCIPTYNRASFLPKAIESVLSQDFTDFELVICDNASNDNTEEVVKNYRDERIRYVRYKYLVSMYANHNRCIDLASSCWLLFVHSDDYIQENSLNKYYQMISQNSKPEIAIYFSKSDYHSYSHQGQLIKGRNAVISFLRDGFFPPTCNIFNLSFLKKNKIFFAEKAVFADAILSCELGLKYNASFMPVPSVSQTWDMNRGSYKNILSSYDNVSFWGDIAIFLRFNLKKDDLIYLISQMQDWDSNTISHLLYRFAFIDWWEIVDQITSELSRNHVSFRTGHYYKHVIILRFFGKKIHKFLYSLIKKSKIVLQ
jgi:glycosyltransferase involved in cell wall biosynthesis